MKALYLLCGKALLLLLWDVVFVFTAGLNVGGNIDHDGGRIQLTLMVHRAQASEEWGSTVNDYTRADQGNDQR